MKWKYLLFDLDGTLTDSHEGIVNSVKHAYRAMGIPIPPDDELLSFIGPPLIDSFQEIAGLEYSEAEKAVAIFRERYYVTGLFENRVYDKIEETLGELREKGYVLAVATSKQEPIAVRVLEHFGLQRYFDVVAGGTMDDTRRSKADVIREALHRLNVSDADRASAIMIGDRKHDIIGAKECGIASLGVYYGFAPAGELEAYGADHVIRDVGELVPFFTL